MKLLTEKDIAQIPPLYATENEKNPLIYVKIFTPDANWSWYIIEYNPATKIAFGYVCGLEEELGYFDIKELEILRGPLGFSPVKALFFEKKTLDELKKELFLEYEKS
jgi:hypothetical protein